MNFLNGNMKRMRLVLCTVVFTLLMGGFIDQTSSSRKVPQAKVSLNNPANLRVSQYDFAVTLRKAISSSKNTLYCLRLTPGVHHVSINLTVPGNLALQLEKGAIFCINNGATLTINSNLEAGPYQIFSWSGNGKVVFGPGAVKEFLIRWWGAKGDGLTDDTPAVQAAINALTSTPVSASLVGSAGDNYRVESLTFHNPSTPNAPVQRLCGNGATLTQYGMSNLLNITSRTGRLRLEQWRMMGSCRDIWSHSGITTKPTSVTFDQAEGHEVKSLTQVDGPNKWYYEKGTIYIYAPCGSLKTPQDVYPDSGVKIDGETVKSWLRYYTGTAIFIGATHGVANIDVSNCDIRYFDKAIEMRYALYNSFRDCLIQNCTYALFGEPNVGSNNWNTFENLRIAAIYGPAAIHWKGCYGTSFRHCIIEYFPHRFGEFISCNALVIDQTAMEANAYGCVVNDVMSFDNCRGISILNSNLWAGGGGSSHTVTSFFRFVNRTMGVTVAGNNIELTDSSTPPSKIALYSTDGTAAGLNFRNNAFKGQLRWTLDSVPCATADNNGFYSPSPWVLLPDALVRYVTVPQDSRFVAANPSFSAETPELNQQCINSAAVIDRSTGVNDLSSWKITWNGPGAQAVLRNFLPFPASGIHWGVLSLFFKSDTAQYIDITWINASACRNIPIAADGHWRYLAIPLPHYQFPSQGKPNGIKITTNVTRGVLWLDDVSVHWFPTAGEASAWVGAADSPVKGP